MSRKMSVLRLTAMGPDGERGHLGQGGGVGEKQNKTKQHKTRQNETKQNKTKQKETKQNKTKQNEKTDDV